MSLHFLLKKSINMNSGVSTLGPQWRREARKNVSSLGDGSPEGSSHRGGKESGLILSQQWDAPGWATQVGTLAQAVPGSGRCQESGFRMTLVWTRTNNPKDGEGVRPQTGLVSGWSAAWRMKWCAQWEMEQKQDRVNSRPCRMVGSKAPWNVFPSTVATCSGTDWGWACRPWGSSKQGREIAQMGIQNPLDQPCPVTHSEKLEKR